jgi:hypothetical protein
LYKPRSSAQERDHPSPVVLRVREPGPSESATVLDATVVLFGRRALAHRGVVRAALDAAGGPGLRDARGSVSFTATVAEGGFEGPLGDWTSRTVPMNTTPQRVLVELVEPCDVRAPDIVAVTCNLAHDLVQWDLEDRGASVNLGKPGCDALADATRALVREGFSGVSIDRGLITEDDRGLRTSGTNRGRFPLRGYRGYLVLSGNLARVLPWLAALSLRGAGGRKSFGLGDVKLWFPPPDPARG